MEIIAYISCSLATWSTLGVFLLIYLDKKGKVDILTGKWKNPTFINSCCQIAVWPYSIYDCWIKKENK